MRTHCTDQSKASVYFGVSWVEVCLWQPRPPALDPGPRRWGRTVRQLRVVGVIPTSTAQASQQGAACRVKVVPPVGGSTLTRQAAPCSPWVG
jgi:hypothetical protein